MWRRIVASVLVVIGVLLLLVSGYGWWAKRYFLDSDRFTAKAHQILEQEAVQEALAVAVTAQISEQSGRDLRIAQPFITNIVREIVASDPFQAIFDAAILRAHHAVMEGGARDMVLNLSDTVDNVRSALKPVAPNLAAEIPKGEDVQVRILDKSQLNTIYDITNLTKKAVVVITILSVLFLVGGVAVSTRRWKTLALAGWVTLGVFVVSLIAVRVGRPITGSFIANESYSDAAESAYKVITRGLMVQGVVFSVLGLLVALGAGWIDRHGGWAAATDAMKHGGSWAKAQMPKKAATPEPALAAAGTTAGTERLAAARLSPTATSEAMKPVTGVLASRLPEPARRARTAHWWRAVALLVVGLYAVFSPGSLTNIVVVLLGLVALYLAFTEGLAAWASPKEPPSDLDTPANGDAGDSPPEDEPPEAA